MKNFVISLILLFYVFISTNALPAIETNPPLPENKLAKGFSGLILRARFLKGQHKECRWNIEQHFSVKIFGPAIDCSNSTRDVICNIEVNGDESFIFTSLTVRDPITRNFSVGVACTKGYVTEMRKILVTDCQSSSPIRVLSLSQNYSSSGEFVCDKNESLFHSNGTYLNTLRTSCLASAKWSSENEVECWKAPIAQLVGATSSDEGTKLNFSCNYTDVYPPGNKTIFSFGDEKTVLDKGKVFQTHFLSIEDNNKPIYCQALTPFTNHFNQTGFSETLYVSVNYLPYQAPPVVCKWKMNQTQYCKFELENYENLTFANISKNGSLAFGFLTKRIQDTNGSAFFYYVQDKVSSQDAGNYEIYFSLSKPPHTIKVPLKIELVESQKSLKLPFKNSSELLIYVFTAIALSLGLYAAIMTILAFIRCKKKSQKRKSMKIGNSPYLEPNVERNLSESDTRVAHFTNLVPDNVIYSPGKENPVKIETNNPQRYETISPDPSYETIPYAETKISMKLEDMEYATMIPQTKM